MIVVRLSVRNSSCESVPTEKKTVIGYRAAFEVKTAEIVKTGNVCKSLIGYVIAHDAQGRETKARDLIEL